MRPSFPASAWGSRREGSRRGWSPPTRHASRLGSAPRLTPNPSLALSEGRVAMAFGTPGVDAQVQAMTQMLMNIVEFGMDAQQAVEAPRVISASHPDSNWPHAYFPAVVRAEARIPEQTLRDLESRGHKIERWPDFALRAGSLCVITVDHERDLLGGGADPRLESAAMGR